MGTVTLVPAQGLEPWIPPTEDVRLEVGDQIRNRDGELLTVVRTDTYNRPLATGEYRAEYWARVTKTDPDKPLKLHDMPYSSPIFSAEINDRDVYGIGDYNVLPKTDRYTGRVEILGGQLRHYIGRLIGYTNDGNAIVIPEEGAVRVTSKHPMLYNPAWLHPVEPEDCVKDQRYTQMRVARTQIHNLRCAEKALEKAKRRANAALVKAHIAFGLTPARAIHQFIADYDQYWAWVDDDTIDLEVED